MSREEFDAQVSEFKQIVNQLRRELEDNEEYHNANYGQRHRVTQSDNNPQYSIVYCPPVQVFLFFELFVLSCALIYSLYRLKILKYAA